MKLYERIIMDLVSRGIPFEFSCMFTRVKGSKVRFDFDFRVIDNVLGVYYRNRSGEDWKTLSWDKYKELIKEEDYEVC